MPWYWPVATPPNPSVYYQSQDDTFDQENNEDGEFEFEDSSLGGSQSHMRHKKSHFPGEGRVAGDELQRRIESLLSPKTPSANLMGPTNDLAMASGSGAYPGFQAASLLYSHPAYRHRETTLPDEVERLSNVDDNAYFFYPHPFSRHACELKEYRAPVAESCAESQHDSRHNESVLFYRTNDDTVKQNIRYHSSGNQSSNQQFQAPTLHTSQLQDNYDSAFSQDDGRAIADLHGTNDRFELRSSDSSRRYTQTNLAQDPSTGGLFSTIPCQKNSSQHQYDAQWNNVGTIGTFHQQHSPLVTEPGEKSKTEMDSRKSSLKMKQNKNKKKQNLSNLIHPQKSDALISSKETVMNHKYSEKILNSRETEPVDRFFNAGKTTKTKKKCKRQAHDEPNMTSAILESESVALKESTFEILSEKYNVRNAGSSEESLDTFVSMVKSHTHVAWTILFYDRTCSTPFAPSSQKYCTAKGPRCTMWNCTCDSQIRAMQAAAPLLGAMFVFPETNDALDGSTNSKLDDTEELSCFILPLGRTLTSEGCPDVIEPGFERMSTWPLIPFECDAALSQRWKAFRSILMDVCVTCVTYNATVGVMPYHFHRANDIANTKESNEGQMDLIIPKIWDLRLASWVLSPHSPEGELEFERKSAGFAHLRQRRHPQPNSCDEQLLGLLKAKEQLEFLFVLYPVVNGLLVSNGLLSSFQDIESPFQSVLAAMECNGVRFRPDRLQQLQSQLENQIEVLTIEARTLSKDSTLLLSSPQQVSRLLFDVMRIELPPGIKIKTVAGSHHKSTSKAVLKALQEELKGSKGSSHRMVDILLEFRKLSKMLTTFIRPLPFFAREVPNYGRSPRRQGERNKKKKTGDGELRILKIHPMWMQTSVRTGRISCCKPNMQQIPVGSVFNVLPRNAFTSSTNDKCLFACDYAQNEVRILAHMSNDAALTSLFLDKNEVDIYKQMSSVITGKDIANVTNKERGISKQVTLAILYGMGIHQVAKNLSITVSTAQNFIDAFFRRFWKVKQWMEETKVSARRLKYVSTISGRRRYLDEIDSADDDKKAQAERQAVNTVIQGSAADLVKLAMLKMATRIMDWNKDGSNAGGTGIAPKLLVQMHDELLFEVALNKDDIIRLKNAVIQCCAVECVEEFKLKVPLKLRCECGMSWGDLIDAEQWLSSL